MSDPDVWPCLKNSRFETAGMIVKLLYHSPKRQNLIFQSGWQKRTSIQKKSLPSRQGRNPCQFERLCSTRYSQSVVMIPLIQLALPEAVAGQSIR